MRKREYRPPQLRIVDGYVDTILVSTDRLSEVFIKDPYVWYD